MGNRGVTKVGVVERGKLQRYEALEDQEDCGSKRFKVQSGAGGGGQSREEASIIIRVSGVRVPPPLPPLSSNSRPSMLRPSGRERGR